MQSCIGRWHHPQLMLRLVEKVLLQHGYQVLVASDGEDAIEVDRRHKLEIDVVLLDVGLPKLTGWDVLSKRQEAYFAEVSRKRELSAAIAM